MKEYIITEEEIKDILDFMNRRSLLSAKEILKNLKELKKPKKKDVLDDSQTEGSSKKERASEVNRTSLDNSEKEMANPFSKSDISPEVKESQKINKEEVILL